MALRRGGPDPCLGNLPPVTHAMSDAKELGITPASAGTGTGAVSLGKGAWDCDANREIPPDKEVRCLGHSRTRPKGCPCGRTACELVAAEACHPAPL